MSRIFRSDAIAPGDRVVLRRVIDGNHSDIIGHVVEVTDEYTRIRPQLAGGFPSQKPEIRVAADEIAIVKKLSPRRVRNSDIRTIETAYAKAFPGIDHMWVDGWLLRAGDGITERSNSAAPLGPSAPFNPVPIKEIRQFYARHNLPPQVLIPERIGRGVEKHVAELGPEIIVMTTPLDTVPDVPVSCEFRIDDQPDDDWLALYHFRGKPLPKHALEQLRRTIDGTMGFGRLLIDGATVAITRGTITDDHLGYSAVEVAPDYRRNGLGTQLGARMMAWGRANGAHTAYLQVIASNTAGIALYSKLGFVEHHRHCYGLLKA
ncbi:MAG: GNAT family N-acetyltransferase [Corynebacterium sp.]|uniref:N-acetylglutamate synthase, CG3035 family n=1 Tax=Corynebacterium sp. TaxID=1720 RepID=UPI0026DC733B|nr:GNAT family N-acetyltransferase [Corynebacterium sp.]MDO5097427.1 GNAT family N-acetyltransferase [Corynebacterium sp.]